MYMNVQKMAPKVEKNLSHATLDNKDDKKSGHDRKKGRRKKGDLR